MRENKVTDIAPEDLDRLGLLIEQGQFELQPYDPIPGVDSALSAFLFERKGRRYVVYWHKTGSASVKLPLDASSASLVLEKELGGQRLVGPVVLGHDQQAAGVFIDAVDDAGPQFAPDAG